MERSAGGAWLKSRLALESNNQPLFSLSILACVITPNGKTVASRRLEHELLAVGANQGVSQGVEVEGTSNGKSNSQVGRSDKAVGGGVAVVSAGEVTVVRGNNGIGLALLEKSNLSALSRERALHSRHG